jgi:ribonucleoside-diphosphate reductase alpha chain
LRDDQRRPIPCGEQPLPPYGACLLGSINLAALVKRPFTADAAARRRGTGALVPLAVRMIDNVIDVSRFPLPRPGEGGQGQAAHRPRRHRPRRRADLVRRALRFARGGAADARMAGRDPAALLYGVGRYRGARRAVFRFTTAVSIWPARRSRRLRPEEARTRSPHGIRNALLTSIAPTGTISLLADNVSSGIEPVFSLQLHPPRADAGWHAKREERSTIMPIRLFRELKGNDAPLPDVSSTPRP